MQLITTLNFGGTCREAIHLYEKAFEGKVACLISYGEANDPQYSSLDDTQKDNIYHSELVLGGHRIFMSDDVEMEAQTCHSNSLTVIYDTEEEVRRAYEVMKEGSRTIYPLETTSYSSCHVVFVDRFGIRWAIMTE